MPSSGLSRRGRATMRSRSARTPPSSSRSARTTWPMTSPPAVLERTRPSATQAEPGRQLGRDGDAAGAGVDQELDRPAVELPGPVVVAVGAAADLDHAALGREGRLLRLALLPLEAEEDERPEQQPDGRELEVRGSSSLIGACADAARPFCVDRAEDRLMRLLAVLHLDPDRVAELHERRLRRAALDRLDRPLLGDAGVAARPVLVADRAAADDRAGAAVARLAQVGDQLAEVEGHLLAGVAQARRACRSRCSRGRGGGGRRARRRRARRASPRPG